MHRVRRDGDRLRWGVLATGRIAQTLSRAIVASQSGRLCAVASRSREGAAAGSWRGTWPEAWQMPWADNLGNMRTRDRWRAAIGLRYPADDEAPDRVGS